MILRSMRIADWRCFLNAVEVGPFDDGLNVIHAPNATGKSTLFEALRRALLDGHRVTGKDVEAIRPWGRELAPKVTVEFLHGGEEYRVSKQFLDSPSALLERKEDGRYQRLAEGAAADDKTREILTKNPPSRGLCRPENWGMAQILWAPQGNLAIETLSGDVIADIRGMLNVQVTSAGTGPIEKQIEERYLEVFSPKGKVKTGKDAPLLMRLKDTHAAAKEMRQKAWDRYLAFEDASRRVEELQARRAQARHDADAISKSLRDARKDAETYRQLTTDRAQRSEKVAIAEGQHKEIKGRIDTIKSTESELSQAQETLKLLEDDVPLRGRELQEREQEATRLKAALEDARKGRESVESARHLADAARRFAECRRELVRLDELIEKERKTQGALADARLKSELAPIFRQLPGHIKM